MSVHEGSQKSTKVFVTAIVVSGGIALSSSLYQLYKYPVPYGWMILSALTLLSFLLTIKVPGIPATISVSETFVFTIVLLFGSAAATVTVALDALIMSLWRHRKDPLKVLFNATEPTLSIWIASQLFFSIVGGTSLRQHTYDSSTLLLPILVLSLTYFLLNSCLTATAIGLQNHTSIITVWRDHFLWLGLNYLGGASVAALIVQNSPDVNFTTLSIILPLLIISYLTFKSSMGRVEDANLHLSQLNQMYMSTIETLAMAVDAKDQITHGHIRRVQSYATQLALALGMDDPSLLRAIEASALLHDIGKLGIPEYILNKPGKLTSAEFEQMKQHTTLGADMLSSIHFPSPVVPIVRHHHENWDGSGYPEGLDGVDIPIGARILAVVDCFDALTSDRPYRQKLPVGDALSVLQDRRGSMYDPLIVDTFVEVQSELTHTELKCDAFSANNSPRSTTRLERELESLAYPSHRRLTTLAQIADSFCSVVAKTAAELKLWEPESLSVIYRLDDRTNELVAIWSSRSTNPSLLGYRIPMAQRVSGWVAANQTVIDNSDAALDLGSLAVRFRLGTTLGVPILSGTVLIGVATVYRSQMRPFTSADVALVTSLASRMGIDVTTEYTGLSH